MMVFTSRGAAPATLLGDHHVIHADEHDCGLGSALDGLALGPEGLDNAFCQHVNDFAFVDIQAGILLALGVDILEPRPACRSG